MANALGNLFGDIADAIRAKTGEEGTMKPAQFPAKIASIEGGGGVDTNYDYMVTVGDSFSIAYSGSSPTVECPSFIEYYDDGGELVFTSKSEGTGTIYLYVSDSLLASYTVKVAAELPIPRLFSPTLSRSGTTVTIANPSSNGSFAETLRLYDNGTLISTQSVGSNNTYGISGFGMGKHTLTAEAVAEKFITSERASMNASKYSVSMTLTNLVATNSLTHAWHGDSLTIEFSPNSGYAMPSSITATMGGSTSGIAYDSSNKKITIASVTGDIVIGITAIKPVTLEETPWSTIAEYAENGTIANYFKIGDTKKVTFTYDEQHQDTATQEITDTFTMEIVAFNHDDLVGGGKAGVTFLMKSKTTANWWKWRSGTYGSNGSWSSSTMRTTFNGKALQTMPAELSSRIKQVIKTCDLGVVEQTTNDYLWIPSMQEVGATSTETMREHGTKYPGATVGYSSYNTTNYVTRNQSQSTPGTEYQRNQLLANGNLCKPSNNACTFRFGFCL